MVKTTQTTIFDINYNTVKNEHLVTDKWILCLRYTQVYALLTCTHVPSHAHKHAQKKLLNKANHRDKKAVTAKQLGLKSLKYIPR